MRLALAVLGCVAAVVCWPGRSSPRRGRAAGRGFPWPGRRRAQRRWRGDAVLRALDALAAGLEVGLAARDALREAAGTTDDLAVREGLLASAAGPEPGGEPAGLGAAGPGEDLEGLALLARAWQLSDRLGTPLAQSVRAVASLLRAEVAARRAVAVAMSEARATVLVLVALPLLGPLLAAAVGVSPADLYGSAPARVSAALGVGLVGLGMWWMRRLLRRVATAGDAR
ncbi:MAG: hypothetical protein IPK37_03415 [Austwickia sp.]|jgi:tight adherence protein B|nr:MAG: hypothetical protein IPK37_03415 [Austwickia sp.]